MLFGMEPEANTVIIISVNMCMYFHIKKFNRKLVKKELIVSALVMCVVFFSLSLLASYYNGNLSSFNDISFFLLFLYSLSIFIFTLMTNILYGKMYMIYKCPECNKEMNYKELKKRKYCPTCDIMAIDLKDN